MRIASLLVLCLVAACGGGGGNPDATPSYDGEITYDAGLPDASLLERCARLQHDYPAALAQVASDCDRVEDCAVVGEQPFGTCDCAPAIGACSGTAVRAAAFHGSQAEAMVDEFAQVCANPGDVCGTGQVECICDCAPAQNLACKNHHCVADDGSCLQPPFDASLPPAPDAGP